MGVGGEKPAMKEIAETKSAGRDAQFEEIIERIKSTGGIISEDQTVPLYTSIGNQELEIGTQRVVEFNLNKKDFQLIRNVETAIIQGAGHQKSLKEIDTPKIRLSLKTKSEYSNEWQIMDLEDIF